MSCGCIGNYHEPNVDWLIAEIKKALSEWDKTEMDWKTLEEYVKNYFDNLDITDEINMKLDEMAEDGTLSTLINQEIFGSYSKRSIFSGKKVVAYGDSLTTVGNSYINQLAEIGNCNVTNRGVGGTRMNQGNNSGVELIDASTDLTNFDICILGYGTNEWQAQENIYDVITDVYTIIQHVNAKNPNMEIIFCLPPYSYNSNTISQLSVYVNAIIYALNHKDIRVPYVDFYHRSTCNPSNYKKLLLNDSSGIYVHPTDAFATELCAILVSGCSDTYVKYSADEVLDIYDFNIAQGNITSLSGFPGKIQAVLAQDVIYRSSEHAIRTTDTLILTYESDKNFKFIYGDNEINCDAGAHIIELSRLTTGFYDFGLQSIDGNVTITNISLRAMNIIPYLDRKPYFGRYKKVTNDNGTLLYRVCQESLQIKGTAITLSASVNGSDSIWEHEFEISEQKIFLCYSSSYELYPLTLNSDGIRAVRQMAAGNYIIPDTLIPVAPNENFSFN